MMHHYIMFSYKWVSPSENIVWTKYGHKDTDKWTRWFHPTPNVVTRGIIMYDPAPYNTTWLHVTHSYIEETLLNPVLYNTIMSNLAQCKTILFNPAPLNTNPSTMHHAIQTRLPCTIQHNSAYPAPRNTIPPTMHHATQFRLPCTINTIPPTLHHAT